MSSVSQSPTLSSLGASGTVMINSASPNDLARLYGVGAVLAARIVEFRNWNGPLQGPDDLARVEGIGADRALALAPFIDWSVPAVDDSSKRNLSAFGISLILIAALIWLNLDIASATWNAILSASWLAVWINASVVAMNLCLSGAIFSKGLSGLTTSRRREQRLVSRSIHWVMLILVPVASIGLGNLFNYLFFEGWDSLLQSPLTLIGLLSGIVLSVTVGSVILVAHRPKHAQNRILVRTVNVSWVFVFLTASVVAWFSRADMPLMGRLVYGAGSIMALSSGIDLLRGYSPFEWVAASIILPREADPHSLWLQWINARLPNPDQQKALRDALQQAHPRSRWHTLSGLLIIGAGTWLLGATTSAIWEWLVQNWLTAWFGKP